MLLVLSYSDDSSIESYDLARECFVVIVDYHADDMNGTGASDGDAPQNPGPCVPRNPGPSAPPTSGPSAPPTSQREALASTRSWTKQ
jgi:hypothetical protein